MQTAILQTNGSNSCQEYCWKRILTHVTMLVSIAIKLFILALLIHVLGIIIITLVIVWLFYTNRMALTKKTGLKIVNKLKYIGKTVALFEH